MTHFIPRFIPYGHHRLNEEDKKKVLDVLESDYLTQGTVVSAFEKRVANYCHAKYACAVNSGTSALHVACLALGLKKGDILWTSAITFVASANCGLYCQAEVDFVDINPDSGNIAVDDLEQKLILAEITGKLPKIVVAVHFAGQPCDIKRIYKLSLQYGFHIIEDACHALGARIDNKPVGDCRYSDITVFSFHPVKMITTAEGGMALTNHAVLASKLKQLSSHGIIKSSDQFINKDAAPWEYEQQLLGFNYRLSEIHAALGLSQMDCLEFFVEQRGLKAKKYTKCLLNLPLLPLTQSAISRSSWHLYVVRLDDSVTDLRRELFNFLRAKNIGVQVHYQPVYQQPYFLQSGVSQLHCPNAEIYYKSCLTLPLYVDLSDEDQDKVIGVLAEGLSR